MNIRVRRETGMAAAACVAALLTVVCGWAAADEAAAIGVLQSDAGFVEKQVACRELRQVGTAAAVPALAALLTDKQLSHSARYALEVMPWPEAGQALRDALPKAEGSAKAGIAISLGARRDAEAVGLLAPLLKDADAEVARAAAGALGRIGNTAAVEALFDAAEGAPEALRPALAEGLLAAAEQAAREGNPKLAMTVYRNLQAPAWPMHVRMGAFAGMIHARPKQAPKRLVKALGGDEPAFRDLAAQLVAESSDPKTTKLYVEALPGLPVEGQVALLRGLADRGDAGARPAVAAATSSADPAVQLAAVKALGALGNAEDVPALTGLMASDNRELAETARATLVSLKAEGIDAALAQAAAQGPAGTRAQVLELLAARGADQAEPLAAQSLADADPAMRTAALRVLGPLGTQERLPAILQALTKAADAAERSAAEKALGQISARHPEAALPVVLEAMKGAETESRLALLRVLGRIGSPQALEVVLASLNDADARVAGEALSVLTDWPAQDAAPHLLTLAQGADPDRKAAGMQGYVRLAEANPSVEERFAMLTKAMALAERPEDKKLVLGPWGSVRTLPSLEALRPYLDDPAIQNEAAVAIIAVARQVGQDANARPQALDALNAVAAKCQDANIRERAQQTLASFK